MAAILQSLPRAVAVGFALTVLLIILYVVWPGFGGQVFLAFLFRWLHVLSGVMWIGLLWYFNFVQIPSMPGIPDEQKPAVSKHIAPRALFWFRWAAAATVLTGLLLAGINEYIVEVLTLGIVGGFGVFNFTLLGIGMWLGLIMAFNVWFVIWPNQKKALGLVDADADTKKAAARTAMLFSRANTVLSVPMLFAMVGAQNLG